MDFKNLLLTNWKTIVLCVLLVIDIFVSIFKKKVKVVDFMTIILNRLPEYIIDAENSGQNGSSKFTMVFSRVVKDLMLLTGLSSEQVCEKFSVQINDAIENNVKVLNEYKKGVKKNDEKI